MPMNQFRAVAGRQQPWQCQAHTERCVDAKHVHGLKPALEARRQPRRNHVVIDQIRCDSRCRSQGDNWLG